MQIAQSVLLLDETPELRALVRAILEPGGHWLHEAASLDEAQSALRGRHFDLVLVDPVLPDGSGLDFLRWLRSWNREVRVLYFLPAWREAQLQEPLRRELGGLSFALRPCGPAELRVALAGALRQTAGRPGSARVVEEPGLHAAVALQREGLRARLPVRLRELEGLVNRGRAQGLGGEQLYRVLRMAHALHTACGTLGFADVAAGVGRVEQLFDRLIAGDVAEFGDFWAQLDEAVARARAGLQGDPDAPSGREPELTLARILVVDADRSLLDAVTRIGRRELVEVLSARGPAEALLRARQGPLDAVLIDPDLGEPEGGLRLARRMRAPDIGLSAPLAVLSGRDTVEARLAAANAGADLFLTRPLDPPAVLEVARQLSTVRRAEPARVLAVLQSPEAPALPLATSPELKVLVTESGRGALGLMDSFDPELALIDAGMLGLSGLDLCRLMRLSPRWQDLPVVLWAPQHSAELHAAALRAGADDVVSGDLPVAELVGMLRQRVARYRRGRDRRDRDPLSGLLNRVVFVDQLAARLGEARRNTHPLSVALLGVDHFAQLNERHGMNTGDRVLSALGRLLGSRFRVEDLRARWGGAEFVVALCGAAPRDAKVVLAGVLEDFQQIAFSTGDGVALRASFCTGLASYPDDGDTVEALVRAANEGLRRARAQGVGCMSGRV